MSRNSSGQKIDVKDVAKKAELGDPELRAEARERWVHEDILINHRLTWLGVTQGLLFYSFGLCHT